MVLPKGPPSELGSFAVHFSIFWGVYFLKKHIALFFSQKRGKKQKKKTERREVACLADAIFLRSASPRLAGGSSNQKHITHLALEAHGFCPCRQSTNQRATRMAMALRTPNVERIRPVSVSSSLLKKQLKRLSADEMQMIRKRYYLTIGNRPTDSSWTCSTSTSSS